MNTAPGGYAMTVRYHTEVPKREDVRRPLAWRLHPADIARGTGEGQHCETRRCRNPVAVVTWRWWRSTAAGRVLVAEHVVCYEHGQAFASRHHIEIEAPPDDPRRGPLRVRGGAQ
jgi:hypothetical protein